MKIHPLSISIRRIMLQHGARLLVGGSLIFSAQTLAAPVAGVNTVAQASDDARANNVGEVSFVIGNARIVDPQGGRVPVSRGMKVHAGERVETTEGGHVHIRFIDGGFVSVRPASRLVIAAYDYDARSPQESTIRLQLEQGVARSITGKGGEAARDRFRLNTPIAAIGVKGTDFVVQAASESIRVTVQSGAVVVSPFSDSCRADSIGPCSMDTSRILSADMGRVMLEYKRAQVAPLIVPINGYPSPDRIAPPAPEEHRSIPQPRADVRNESVPVETSLPQRPVPPPIQPPAPEEPAPPPVKPPPVVIAPPAPEPPPIVTPPPVVIPSPPLPPSRLVWGRWSWVPQLPEGTSTVKYGDAWQEGTNESITGNIALASLMRPTSARNATLPTNLGRAAFSLRDSEVYLVRQGNYSPGQVTGGWLNVDFAARSFKTELGVSHVSTGAINISAAGNFDKKGEFIHRSPDTRIGGAFTLDGQEAGYHFERMLGNGSLIGLTRWVR